MRDEPDASTLLDWYDAHARVMPWRVGPTDHQSGQRPDPYRVWLSEVMLQQTTVAAVEPYFLRFIQRWPDVVCLAQANDADVMGEWAGLGYYARARNLLKCARVIASEYGGAFPDTREALLALPGIGPYTASAIAAIAFDEPATVVDGNVERVISRIHAVTRPLPDSKTDLHDLASRLTPVTRPGDYAQAIMDLGATICTPKSPACGICPWNANCKARHQGIAADLPRKAPKKVKPTRFGIAYVARRADGAWLLETRPDSGLLGGMLGWPGSDWRTDAPEPEPPVETAWKDTKMEVRHTFTHFHLRLKIMVSDVSDGAVPMRGNFMPKTSFRPSDLPTVMRKVYDVASKSLLAIEPSEAGTL